jgi:hypothetical protein
MAVFRISVMAPVVAWGLDKTDALKQGNKRAILRRCLVRPLVDLVGIGPKNYDQPNLPGEHSEQPGNHNYRKSDTKQQPRTLEPTVARKIAWVVMMKNVWFGNQPANERPVLSAVGVLKPMKKAGPEIGHQHRHNDFDDNHKFGTGATLNWQFRSILG